MFVRPTFNLNSPWTIFFAPDPNRFIKQRSDFAEKDEPVSESIASAEKKITKITEEIKNDSEKQFNKIIWYHIPKDSSLLSEQNLFIYVAVNEIASFVVPLQTQYRLLKNGNTLSIISKEVPGYRDFAEYYRNWAQNFSATYSTLNASQMHEQFQATELPENLGGIMFIRYLYQDQDLSIWNFGVSKDNAAVGLDYEFCFPAVTNRCQTLLEHLKRPKQVISEVVEHEVKKDDFTEDSLQKVVDIFSKFNAELFNRYGDKARSFINHSNLIIIKPYLAKFMGEKIALQVCNLFNASDYNDADIANFQNEEHPLGKAYEEFSFYDSVIKIMTSNDAPIVLTQEEKETKLAPIQKKLAEAETNLLMLLQQEISKYPIKNYEEINLAFIHEQGKKEIEDDIPMIEIPGLEMYLLPRMQTDVNIFHSKDYDNLPRVTHAIPQRWMFRSSLLKSYADMVAKHEQFLNEKHYYTLKFAMILPLCQLILNTLLSSDNDPLEIIRRKNELAYQEIVSTSEKDLLTIFKPSQELAYQQLVCGLDICMASTHFRNYFVKNYQSAIRAILYELAGEMKKQEANKAEDQKSILQQWEAVCHQILDQLNKILKTLSTEYNVKPLSTKERKDILKYAKRVATDGCSEGMIQSIYRFYHFQGKKSHLNESELKQKTISNNTP